MAFCFAELFSSFWGIFPVCGRVGFCSCVVLAVGLLGWWAGRLFDSWVLFLLLGFMFVIGSSCSWVARLLSCWAVIAFGCWAGAVVGLVGCWATGLLGCWVVELLGRVFKLLGCWVGLVGCQSCPTVRSAC